MATSQLTKLPDNTDWRILDVLQTDARLSFREIGRRVGLSSPTIAERIRRMEESGVIVGYHVTVGLDTLFPIIAIVRINAPEQNCVALGARAREMPEVIEPYRVTGDDRLVAKVVAQSVQHLDSVIAQLAHYGTVTTSVILRSRSRPVTPMRHAVAAARHRPRVPRRAMAAAARAKRLG